MIDSIPSANLFLTQHILFKKMANSEKSVKFDVRRMPLFSRKINVSIFLVQNKPKNLSWPLERNANLMNKNINFRKNSLT